MVGARPQVAGRHHDVFGERAVAVHADADGVRAQVLLAGAAVAAVAADDMALGRNPLADRVAAYAGSDLDDPADEFMDNGRESSRERGGSYVSIPVVRVSLKQKNK